MNLGLRSSETAETHQTKTLETALVDTKKHNVELLLPQFGVLFLRWRISGLSL